MKKNKFIQKIIFILILSIGLGCESNYLDTPPKDQIETASFFKTENQLQTYINGLYEMLPGQSVYEDDAASDNIVRLIVPENVKGTRQVPVESESGGWNWRDLRNINYFLDNVNQVKDNNIINKYSGYAKFFRAYFYYNKVKRFGDVPWYENVIKADSDELYKARDSRQLVMDNVLKDINDAVQYIPKEVDLNRITKYTALILKARICLFEGTFRKYHGLENYQKFLNEAVKASEELIDSGAYTLYSNGDVNSSYGELFNLINQVSTETILARDFDSNYSRHSIGNLATSPTNGAFGATRDFINSYLLKDGSRFTDLPNYNTMGFFDEMQDRDPRLTQTIGGPNFTAYQKNEPEIVDLSFTTTGYRVVKSISTKDQWGYESSINDIIIFRYAEALLIFAEAKAELGSINQNDLDKSVNKLRDRVGMPHINLISVNASPDAYLENMYPNVNGNNKGVILEIRRERRVELFMEGLRWDDLMRWKAGKKLEQPFLGIYFKSLGAYDFNDDGKTDVYLHDGDASGAPAGTPSIINVTERLLSNGTSGNFLPFNETIVFDEAKDYLYPIPLEEISLNSNLTQNPGW